MADFPTREAAVESVRPGWKIVGTRPYVINTTQPVDNPLPGQPTTRTVSQTAGTILSIQGPNGEPDEMTIASPEPAGRGQPAQVSILQGPGKAITGDKPSDPSTWQPVYTIPGKPESGQIGQWDPKNNEFHPQAAGAGAKPTGTYTNVIDPNDPTNKRVIGMVDKGDNSWHAVSTDPNLPSRQIVTTPTAVYAVGADNTVSKLFDIDKTSPFQAVMVDGKPFRFDPNTGEFTAGPVTEHPDIKDQNGLAMVWTPDAEGGGKYAYPPGVEPAKTMTGAGTTSPYLIWYNAQTGQEISRSDNPNFREDLPAVSTTAPKIPRRNPSAPGGIEWIPNPALIMAPQALQDLAAQLTGEVVDSNNPLTLDQAKAIIDAANAQMTAATSAATTAMQTTQQGAATGAGMLQQRAGTAQNLVQQGLGMVQGNRDITMPLPGIGAQLAGGAAAFATELGGGQEVYDTAARLVKSADPQGGNPMMSAAAATLTQVMQRYKQATGQDHPLVQATKAAQASQTAGGLVAPGTPAPVAAVAPVAPVAPVAVPLGQMYGASPTAGAGQALGDPYGLSGALGFTAPGMVR